MDQWPGRRRHALRSVALIEVLPVPAGARGLPVRFRIGYNRQFLPYRASRLVLGGRPTVGHMALDHGIGVRIPASQPILSESFQARQHTTTQARVLIVGTSRPARQAAVGWPLNNAKVIKGLSKITRVRIPDWCFPPGRLKPMRASRTVRVLLSSNARGDSVSSGARRATYGCARRPRRPGPSVRRPRAGP